VTFEDTSQIDVSWAGRTANDIRAVGRAAGSVAIIPVGSIEQHGGHLPTATDTILVDAVARAGAERAVDSMPILVTPPVWSGLSPHHMDLGGTLTLSAETMLRMLRDIAAAVLSNEFDALFLLNGHGGNIAPIGTSVMDIGRDASDAEILGATYFQLAQPFIDEIRDSETGGMSHGGEFETSLMLYLQPELVRLDDAKAEQKQAAYRWCGADMFESGPLSVYRPFSSYSDTGAIGAPDAATHDKGEQIYQRLCEELEAILLAIHEENIG
jgi:creatinine amidohydrolase